MTVTHSNSEDSGMTDATASLRQRLAYDIAPDGMLVTSTTRLGLHPASKDVVDAEMSASRERRQSVAKLSPLLHVMAGLSSEVMNSAILVGRQETDTIESVDSATSQEIYAATFAILANLVDMGVVHLAHPGIGDQA